MHIGLDARELIRPSRRGIGKSLDGLYAQVLAQRPSWRVTAYHRGEPGLVVRCREALACLGTGQVELKRIEATGDRCDAWLHARLPWAAWRDGVDVLHCPANNCPRYSRVPVVACVHDLIPIDFPLGLPIRQRLAFARSLRRIARRAEAIHCPSDHTRTRLISYTQCDSSKVYVTPWGPTLEQSAMRRPMTSTKERATAASPRHASLGDGDAIHEDIDALHGLLDRPFVLHFGSEDRRKNTLRLVTAWGMLTEAQRAGTRLIVIGLEDAEAEGDASVGRAGPVRATVRELKRLGLLGDSVVLAGYVDDATAWALLRRAVAMAYPSAAEGYGLPIVDAFAAGTPVLTSPRGSLPEVGGEAAMYVDPDRLDQLIDGLATMLGQVALRGALVERGRERLRSLGWRHAAGVFIDTLSRAAGVASAVVRDNDADDSVGGRVITRALFEGRGGEGWIEPRTAGGGDARDDRRAA